MTADGVPVHRITLGDGALKAEFLTLGATLESLRLDGLGYSLTVGAGRLEDYEGGMRYHGTLIAPVVNRFTDGRAVAGGREMKLERNLDGRHNLHSGGAGTHLKVWRIAEVTPDRLDLALDLPDGEGGFPGNRRVAAEYSLASPAVLRLTITARTDRPTVFNAANHSYWNLDGAARWTGHGMRIAAEHYLPATSDFRPTGEIAPVAGTSMDFRLARTIAPDDPPLDHCFCLARRRGPLRSVLWLTGRSGVAMEVATTEPGIQVYDGRHAARPGRGAYEGLAIEPECWPDAPNHRGFPSIELLPGETYRQITEWRFSCPGINPRPA
ncbi:MAG: aldose epimerase family protein [Paracoccaceae bacterium]